MRHDGSRSACRGVAFRSVVTEYRRSRRRPRVTVRTATAPCDRARWSCAACCRRVRLEASGATRRHLAASGGYARRAAWVRSNARGCW